MGAGYFGRNCTSEIQLKRSHGVIHNVNLEPERG